jgi:hypothetical protein
MGPHGCRCWGRRREILRSGEKDRHFYLTRELVILTALSVLAVVFEIERQSNSACGAPSGTDMAPLRIARLHQGN